VRQPLFILWLGDEESNLCKYKETSCYYKGLEELKERIQQLFTQEAQEQPI
jgi:hypothetical protein